MKPSQRQHLVATIFPASMLEMIRQHSELSGTPSRDEIVFVRGMNNISGRRVRMIAEAFVRSGKTIRVVRTLPPA